MMAQRPTTKITAKITRYAEFPVRGHDGKFPLRAPIPPSCPQGYTSADLEIVFGDDLPRFDGWMNGQTMGICNGHSYRYNREHTGKCDLDTPECAASWGGFDDHKCMTHCDHSEGDPYQWFCGYSGGGETEDTECADHPHGVVVYRWDVERYIESLVTGRLTVWD